MIGIIGAGPTGLSIGYMLKKRGVAFQIIERESAGHTWKNQYEALHLNSLRDVSGLPGMAMPKSFAMYPSAQEFAQYLSDYAKAFDLPITKATVTQVKPSQSGFEVQSTAGRFEFESLIVASGIWGKPFYPFAEKAPFQGETFHASAYRNATPFVGKRVLVVGAGSTASDVVMDLVGTASEVSMAVAHGVNIVPPIDSVFVFNIFRAIFDRPWLFKLLHPILVKMRPDHSALGLPTHPMADTLIGYSVILGDKLVNAVKEGKVKTFKAFKSFSATGAVFEDGKTVDADVIIFATGYRADLGFAAECFEMDEEGFPLLQDLYRSTQHANLLYVAPGKDYEHNIGWLPKLEQMANMVLRRVLTK